jgi:hypothetical protein
MTADGFFYAVAKLHLDRSRMRTRQFSFVVVPDEREEPQCIDRKSRGQAQQCAHQAASHSESNKSVASDNGKVITGLEFGVTRHFPESVNRVELRVG